MRPYCRAGLLLNGGDSAYCIRRRCFEPYRRFSQLQKRRAAGHKLAADALSRPNPIQAPPNCQNRLLQGCSQGLEHVPPELNRQDSHGVLDRRFYRH